MKTVTKIKVRDSWAIQEIFYDEGTQTLSVHMLNTPKGQNKTLRYSGVPVEVWREFTRAESKGRYFNFNIRNVYPYLGES